MRASWIAVAVVALGPVEALVARVPTTTTTTLTRTSALLTRRFARTGEAFWSGLEEEDSVAQETRRRRRTAPSVEAEPGAAAARLTTLEETVAQMDNSHVEEVRSDPKERMLATAALVFVAMLWGTNFPAVRFLVSDAGLAPESYAVARFGLAAVALSPLLFRATSRGAVLSGLECGAWIALGYLVQCVGLETTTAAKGALFATLQVAVVPAVVAIFPALRPGDEPSADAKRVEWLCAACALCGVALLEVGGLTPPVLGDAAVALQPVFFGISYLRISSAVRAHPEDGLAMSAAQTVSVAALATAWFAASHAQEGPAAALVDLLATVTQGPTAAVVAWTALASTALTIILQTYALSRVSAATASILVASEALWAALLAAAFLSERDYGAFDALGAVLILAASVGPTLALPPPPATTTTTTTTTK